MNHYTAILEAIKYLHKRGVDVSPYLERVAMVIGEKQPLNDVFNHDYKEKGVNFRVDVLPSFGHKISMKDRDPREPNKLQKLKLERWIQDIFVRRLKEQLRMLRSDAQKLHSGKKSLIPKPKNDKNFIDELISALLTGLSDGITLFSEIVGIGFDFTQANENAATWASEYAFELVKGIDATTEEVLQNAITNFVEGEGQTIFDVYDRLEPYFGDIRASQIAVTETTRAFAEGQKVAAEELKNEFPEIEIYKTWFTNNDDIVCEDCGPLDGKEVLMNDEFGDGIDAPPYHVNCRCWIDYNTKVGE